MNADLRNGAALERLNARDAERLLSLARTGDFESAWCVSDDILRRTPALHDPRLPRHIQQVWNGSPLAGKSVLVRCYHGLGDTIQFVRYIPRLCNVARSVTLWVQPQLMGLVASLPACVSLLPLHDGTPGVAFEIEIEVMELMYSERTTLATIPREVPYLFADAALLPASATPRIGIVWRAGEWKPERSVTLDALSPLLARPGIDWRGLQFGARPGESHPGLTMERVDTVDDLARAMMGLDLLITIDSMPAHLAGALGIPVWVLLPEPCDWRWLTDRDDSPWYPTMRLFRQVRPGEWEDAIRRVADALDSMTSSRLS